ncbi:hypothetical protein SOVF_041330 isoform B [Spinacia oleracea]|nr:hypothetical protein SOVF_041330 isoform B [Spinacia oleracea]
MIKTMTTLFSRCRIRSQWRRFDTTRRCTNSLAYG